MGVFVGESVCVCGRECVCVCGRERGRDQECVGERVWKRECVRESAERECVCERVCVRERKSVCENEREREHGR